MEPTNELPRSRDFNSQFGREEISCRRDGLIAHVDTLIVRSLQGLKTTAGIGEDVARSSLLGTGLHAGIGDRGTTKVGPGRYKALLSLSTMKASFCLSSWIALLLLARLHAVHDNNPHCGGIGGERGDPCYVSPPDIATPPCCCGTGPIRIADAERLLVISSSSSSFLSLSLCIRICSLKRAPFLSLIDARLRSDRGNGEAPTSYPRARI